MFVYKISQIFKYEVFMPKFSSKELDHAKEVFKKNPHISKITISTMSGDVTITRAKVDKILKQKQRKRPKKMPRSEIVEKGFIITQASMASIIQIFNQIPELNVLEKGQSLSDFLSAEQLATIKPEVLRTIKFDKTIIKDNENNIYAVSASILGKGGFGEVAIAQVIRSEIPRGDVEGPVATPTKLGEYVAMKRQPIGEEEDIPEEFTHEKCAGNYHFGHVKDKENLYSFVRLIEGQELGDFFNQKVLHEHQPRNPKGSIFDEEEFSDLMGLLHPKELLQDQLEQEIAEVEAEIAEIEAEIAEIEAAEAEVEVDEEAQDLTRVVAQKDEEETQIIATREESSQIVRDSMSHDFDNVFESAEPAPLPADPVIRRVNWGDNFATHLDISALFDVCVDIAKGVQTMHRKNILHLDLKPQNIMIKYKDHSAKILDYGISAKLVKGKAQVQLAGTPGHWAPEIYRYAGTKIKTVEVGASADLYGLGATFQDLILTLADQVFEQPKAEQVILNIMEPGVSGYIPRLANIRFENPKSDPKIGALNELLTLIEKLKKSDPEKRPNVEEVIQTLNNAHIMLFQAQILQNLKKAFRNSSLKTQYQILKSASGKKTLLTPKSISHMQEIIDTIIKEMTVEKFENAEDLYQAFLQKMAKMSKEIDALIKSEKAKGKSTTPKVFKNQLQNINMLMKNTENLLAKQLEKENPKFITISGGPCSSPSSFLPTPLISPQFSSRSWSQSPRTRSSSSSSSSSSASSYLSSKRSSPELSFPSPDSSIASPDSFIASPESLLSDLSRKKF